MTHFGVFVLLAGSEDSIGTSLGVARLALQALVLRRLGQPRATRYSPYYSPPAAPGFSLPVSRTW